MKKIGFIGCGNMAQAMIGGIVKSGIFSGRDIIVSDLNKENLAAAKKKYGIETAANNSQCAEKADILILAVKPNLYERVISEIRGMAKKDVVVVTIAAGRSIESTEKAFGREIKVVRVMPNTPSLVGEGMSSLCINSLITEEELQEIVGIFESFGRAEVVDEKLMDVVTSVSGSAPAYIYMFIEAMADGAVLDGMPREKAYKMAAQTVLGAAKMVVETGRHPGQLKDEVCSPGGTTIEAVATFEEKGLRNAVITAMRRCTKKSKEMSS